MVWFRRFVRRVAIVLLCGSVAAAVWIIQHGGAFPPAAPPPASTPVLRMSGGRAGDFNPEIRVHLTTASSANVRCDGGYVIRLPGTQQVLARGNGLNRSEVRATDNGIRIGLQSMPATRIELLPDKSPAVWVGGRQYRGRLQLFRLRTGEILIVNALPLEEYLASVVDSEMPLSFGEEARRAQAIAARTYALYQMQQNRTHPYYDVFDSERSQRYQGVKYETSAGKLWAGESDSSRALVAETAGIVCLHDGKLFCTYYSAACGGRTTPGRDLFSDAAPPLKSVECDWCRESDLYRWTRTISRAEFERVAATRNKGAAPTVRPISSVRDAAGDLRTSRPNDQLTVGDGSRVWQISHESLRTSLPSGRLPSPLFRAHLRGDELIVEGRGHGHGVGLCQWGCRGQATEGRTALEILSTYYPGSRLVRLTTSATATRRE